MKPTVRVASKRGGDIEFFPLDMRCAEDRYRRAPLDFLTADKVFDARWALTLMDEAMDRLCKEHAGQGKTSIFETLKPFIDPINSKAVLSYEQVADKLQVRVGSVKKLIFRLRKRYASVLRENDSDDVFGLPGHTEIHNRANVRSASMIH